MRNLLACALAATSLFIQPALASERISGSFTATRACEAYKSFRNKTNPGEVMTSPGSSYKAVEVNNSKREWIRIEIPGMADGVRWVAGDCGRAEVGAASAATSAATGSAATGSAGAKSSAAQGQCNVANRHDSYVLAMSWQPGFCEHVRYGGRKPECDALADRRLAIDHLTLHGLWPNRQGCGARYGNCPGAPLQLEKSTIARIAPWMPNFHYETGFGSYEWSKHGTCQSLPDDEYFITAVEAVKLVDGSAVGRHIREHLGRKMSVKGFFAQVRASHGEQVAGSLTLVCARSNYLQEIRLALPLDFRTDRGIEQLASAPGNRLPMTSGCGSDMIHVERAGPG